MSGKSITFKYTTTLIIVVIATWLIHEFAHWVTSELLGYDAVMTLNSSALVRGQNPTEWHKIYISAAGPIVTLLQGLLAYIFLRKGNWNAMLYAVLFTAFYMRFAAGLMNFISLNDEGRISVFFKLGIFTLPAIMSLLLFMMVYSTSKRYRPGWKFQLVTTLIVMFVSSALILSNQFFRIQVL